MKKRIISWILVFAMCLSMMPVNAFAEVYDQGEEEEQTVMLDEVEPEEKPEEDLEPETEPVTEPETEPETEPVTEPTTEPTEESTEATTEAATEPTEEATEAPTEELPEETAEAPQEELMEEVSEEVALNDGGAVAAVLQDSGEYRMYDSLQNALNATVKYEGVNFELPVYVTLLADIGEGTYTSSRGNTVLNLHGHSIQGELKLSGSTDGVEPVIRNCYEYKMEPEKFNDEGDPIEDISPVTVASFVLASSARVHVRSDSVASGITVQHITQKAGTLLNENNSLIQDLTLEGGTVKNSGTIQCLTIVPSETKTTLYYNSGTYEKIQIHSSTELESLNFSSLLGYCLRRKSDDQPVSAEAVLESCTYDAEGNNYVYSIDTPVYAAESHVYDSTGQCPCGGKKSASVDGTLYEDIGDAVRAAMKKDDSTVTLLTDVSTNYLIRFENCNFTIDWNGHTLKGTVFAMNSGNVTLKDSKGGGGMSRDNGKCIYLNGGTLTISGGRYSGGEQSPFLMNLEIPCLTLPAGYVFYNDAGKVVNWKKDEFEAEPVTCKPHAVHAAPGEDGLCICGLPIAASVTNGDQVVGYYVTLKEALAAADQAPGSTLTLFQDAENAQEAIPSGTFTIDWNGHSLTGSSTLTVTGGNVTLKGTGGVENAEGSELNIQGGTVTIQGGSYAKAILGENAKVSLSGGSFGQIQLESAKALEPETFRTAFAAEGYYLYDDSGTPVSAVAVLAAGTENSGRYTYTIQGPVNVAAHTHSYDSTGVCPCGVTAEAKIGDTFYETLQKALSAADTASAASESAHPYVVLLKDVAGGTYDLPKNVILDLNGHHLQGELRVFWTLSDSEAASSDLYNGSNEAATVSSVQISQSAILGMSGDIRVGSTVLKDDGLLAMSGCTIESITMEGGMLDNEGTIENVTLIASDKHPQLYYTDKGKFNSVRIVSSVPLETLNLSEFTDGGDCLRSEGNLISAADVLAKGTKGDDGKYIYSLGGAVTFSREHAFDNDTGLCPCGYQAAAKVNGTAYKSFDQALDAVGDTKDGLLVLLKDVAMPSNGSYGFTTKIFTIDWNGHTANMTFKIEGGSLTLIDSKGGGGMSRESGECIILRSGQLKIEGGSYFGRRPISGKLSCLTIPTGYVFYDQSGSVVEDWKTDGFASGSTVTVKPHDPHTPDENGECFCGLKYAASVTAGGKTGFYETLEEAIKNVTDGATVKLLQSVTLKNTLTIDSGTFTLDLDDKMLSYSGTCNLAISGTADVTLKGRAGKLPSGSLWQGGIKNLGGGGRAVEVTGGKLTIAANTTEQIGSGSAQMGVLLYSYGKYNSDRALYVDGGQVTVNGGYFDCSKTAIEVRSGILNFNNGQIGWYDYSSGSWVKNSCAISVWGGNVNISGGEIVANGTALSVNNDSAKVTLSGGSYDSIWVQDGRVDDLLADRCGYQDADGSWKGFAECASESIRNVNVVSGAPIGRVTVTPETASLTLGYTQGTQLTADVTTSVNPAYQWYEYTGDDASNAQEITGATGNTYTVPTGKAAGTYRYFCVVSVGDFARQSGVATVTVEAKAQEDLNKVGGGISMDDGTYGEKLGAPSFTKPEGTESTKITYAPKGTQDFKETAPTEPGDYTVKIECETQDKIYVGTKDFTIHKAVYNGAKEVTLKVPSTGSTKNQVTLPDVPEGAGYGDVTSAAAFLDLSSVKRNDKTLSFTTTQVGAGTSGTMEVQVTGGDNYQDYKITVTMEVVDKATKPLEGTVTMPQWTYGDQPKDPTFTAPEGHDKTTYLYAPKGSADFKETVPKDAGDYTVKIICETNLEIYTATKDFTIEKREVSFAWVRLTNREYAPNDVSVSIYGKLKNLVDGDKVSFTATVETPDAGSNKPVTVTLTGEDADNYKLDVTGVNANGNRVTISPKVVNKATILVASGTYVYDGTAKTPSVTVKDGDDVIPADEYTVTYSDNVKSGQATVTVTDQNGSGGNYYIMEQTGSFTITKREVIVSGIAAEDRTYNGDVNADLDCSKAAFANLVQGDTLTVTATGTFADAKVGTGKTVTITGLTLGGKDAENYVLAAEGQQTTAKADITKRDITITGVTAVEREYEKGNTSVTLTGGTLQNLVTGDDVSFTLGTGTVATADVGTDKPVTTAITLTGTKADNYVLTQPDMTVTITHKKIAVSKLICGYEKSLPYNGEAQEPEVKLLSPGIGVIDPKEYTVIYGNNIKPGKATLRIVSKPNGNYDFDWNVSDGFTITPREVTVSGVTAEDKVYDGTTAAALDYSNVTFANMVEGEDLTVTATGTFDSANVGTGRTVTITGLTLGGKDKDNYTLAANSQTEATASISAKAVADPTIEVTPGSYVYDGTAKEPTVTVKDGNVVIPASEYNVSYSGNVKPGQAAVTVTNKDGGNYVISEKTEPFTIDKAVYNGTKTVEVTVPSAGSDRNQVTLPDLPEGAKYGIAKVTGAALNNTSLQWSTDRKTITFTTTAHTAGTTGKMEIRVTGAECYEDYTVTVTVEAVDKTPQTLAVTMKGWTYGEDANAPVYTAPAGTEATTITYANGSQSLGATAPKNAGTYTVKVVCETYLETYTGTAEFTVMPKEVTVTGVTAENKVYDGSTTATLDYSGVNIANIVAGDTLTVTATGSFDTANVGTGKTVNITGLTLGGKDAGNYVLAAEGQQTTAKADITKRDITITGVTAVEREYEKGDTSVTLTGGALQNLVTGDDVSFTLGTGTMADANAGTDKKVTTNITLTGEKAGNYVLTQPADVTVTITSKVLYSYIVDHQEYVQYDGTAQEPEVKVYEADFSPPDWRGDLIDPSEYTVTYSDNVKPGEASITVADNPGGNYTVYSSTGHFTITQREVTISGITAENKVYDGSTTATLDHSGVNIANIVAGETLTVTATGTFENAAAGTNKTVTLTGLTLGGEDKDNYVLAADGWQTTAKADITAREVTVSGITAENKTYDGTTAATLDCGKVTFGNIVAGETLTVTATGTFENAAAGTNKTVTLTGLTLGGEDKDNYVLAADGRQTTAKADITAREVTVSGITAENKTYDGGTDATVTGTATINGKIGNDDVTVKTGKAAFAEKNVGTWDVTFSGFELEGGDKDNYRLTTQPASVKASIGAKNVTITGLGAEGKTYDGNTTATVTGTANIDGKVGNDKVTVKTGKAAFAEKNVGTWDVTFSGFELEGNDAGNYHLTAQPAKVKVDITAREVTVSGITTKDKTYDGTTDATLDCGKVTFGNIVAGDTLTVTATGSFENAAAGTNKTVTITGLTLGGKDKDNYVLAADGQQTTAKASILATRNYLSLEGKPDFDGQTEIWIDGVSYPIQTDGGRYVLLPDDGDLMTTYTYETGDSTPGHENYPTGMRVYSLERKDGGAEETHIEVLDDLLMYEGCSIRVSGKWGIRMITSMTKDNKQALTKANLAGYTLEEYGTVVQWVEKLGSNSLTLDTGKYNFAYSKEKRKDPVFANVGSSIQYTNVLVDFSLEECSKDMVLRPYIILKDANGNKVTLYGGCVTRSIGYIAYQNRSEFKAGSSAYKYVWEIIHAVYGDRYDSEYVSK